MAIGGNFSPFILLEMPILCLSKLLLAVLSGTLLDGVPSNFKDFTLQYIPFFTVNFLL
jgi:hypothetical protein